MTKKITKTLKKYEVRTLILLIAAFALWIISIGQLSDELIIAFINVVLIGDFIRRILKEND